MGNNSVPKFIFRLSSFPVYMGSVLGRFYCIMLHCNCAVIHDNVDLEGGGGRQKTLNGLWCDGYIMVSFVTLPTWHQMNSARLLRLPQNCREFTSFSSINSPIVDKSMKCGCVCNMKPNIRSLLVMTPFVTWLRLQRFGVTAKLCVWRHTSAAGGSN